MAKKDKNKMKITKGQIHTMVKSVRRDEDIANGVKPFSTKVHKSAKAYKRKAKHPSLEV